MRKQALPVIVGSDPDASYQQQLKKWAPLFDWCFGKNEYRIDYTWRRNKYSYGIKSANTPAAIVDNSVGCRKVDLYTAVPSGAQGTVTYENLEILNWCVAEHLDFSNDFSRIISFSADRESTTILFNKSKTWLNNRLKKLGIKYEYVTSKFCFVVNLSKSKSLHLKHARTLQ